MLHIGRGAHHASELDLIRGAACHRRGTEARRIRMAARRILNLAKFL